MYTRTDRQIWRLGEKIFLGALLPQTKNCGWLIDWSIDVNLLIEYGLTASCSLNNAQQM